VWDGLFQDGLLAVFYVFFALDSIYRFLIEAATENAQRHRQLVTVGGMVWLNTQIPD
jgi:uncharacterized membrane protein YozB (DUF420 family)